MGKLKLITLNISGFLGLWVEMYVMTDSLVFSLTFLNVFGRVASPCLFHSE